MPHTSYREFLLIQNKLAGVQSGSSQRDSMIPSEQTIDFKKGSKTDDDLTIWHHSILFGGPAEEPGPMQCEINGHKGLCSESNSSVALSIDSGRLWWWDAEICWRSWLFRAQMISQSNSGCRAFWLIQWRFFELMVCVDHPRDIPESLNIKLKRFFKARKMCWKRLQQYSSWLTHLLHLGWFSWDGTELFFWELLLWLESWHSCTMLHVWHSCTFILLIFSN